MGGLGALWLAAVICIVTGFTIYVRNSKTRDDAKQIKKALLIMLLLIVLISGVTITGHSFLYGTKACSSCHILSRTMAYATQSYDGSGHGANYIGCKNCHYTSDLIKEKLWRYQGEEKQIVKSKIIKLISTRCKSCHEQKNSDYPAPSVYNVIFHQSKTHTFCSYQDHLCLDCHAPQVHQFNQLTSLCGNCHKSFRYTREVKDILRNNVAQAK